MNSSSAATLRRCDTEMLRWLDCVHRIPSRSQYSQNSPDALVVQLLLDGTAAGQRERHCHPALVDDLGIGRVKRHDELLATLPTSQATVTQVHAEHVAVRRAVRRSIEHEHMFASGPDVVLLAQAL
jgi:hypothetical protein